MKSRTSLVLAGLAVVALSGLLAWWSREREGQDQRIHAMERTIETLEASLKEKEDELRKAQLLSRGKDTVPLHEPGRRAGHETARASTDSYEVLKALEDDSATDPRSYAEKLQQLLADNPTAEAAAIASRFVFNKAGDRQGLPDDALQALYASQTDPDLKRVVAQVQSQRGNDALLNDQIAAAQTTLKSANPRDRLDALSQLGKIHSVHAVDTIAPYLQDSDSTVRLAALFALRDSGNQRHVGLVEPLTSDPDPSVSALAGTVASALRDLSSSARTSYSRADIEAELPPIANP